MGTQAVSVKHLPAREPGNVARRPSASAVLRPALLARYQDLARTRHDFPLVLDDGRSGPPVRSLTSIVNEVLRKIAPHGVPGERMRRHVLKLETEVRTLVAGGAAGSLLELFDRAAGQVLARHQGTAEEREALSSDLDAARAAVPGKGALLGFGEDMPARLLRHCWNVNEQGRSRAVLAELDEIRLRLSDILKSDFAKAPEASTAAALEATLGAGYDEEIDCAAMARILGGAPQDQRLPDKRRERVRRALAVLESQRLFAGEKRGHEGDRKPYPFVFPSLEQALQAFETRLAEMAEFVKAVRIARLEIENRYDEQVHDALFDAFGPSSLTSAEIAVFPSYLVLPEDGARAPEDRVRLLEVLGSDVPVKVLVTERRLFDAAPLKSGRSAFGGLATGLAAMAVGLENPFVVQASASHLYEVAEDLVAALKGRGPALFHVYAGGAAPGAPLPAYLEAAAATESRAFPTFVFRPDAGGDFASRFRLCGNPQPEKKWPLYPFAYEDRELQAVKEMLSFTFVDFLACDPRFAECFEPVPQKAWTDNMAAVGEVLELPEAEARRRTPYVLLVDEDFRLHRSLVSPGLLAAARRAAAFWRSLQELGGIENSHARALVAKEKAAWEEAKRKEIEEVRRTAAPPAAPAAPAAAAPPAEKAAAAGQAPAAAEAVKTDEPWIETPRCTTCNECINLNNRIFAYNENKQAFIKDATAGPFRALVEAAERCKVAIIHPGKPKNPDEPDLEELVKRAESFK